MMKIKVIFSLLFVLTVGFVYFSYVFSNTGINSQQPTEKYVTNSLRTNSSTKKILLWNSHWRIEASAFGTGQAAFVEANCLIQNCEIVTNSSEFWRDIVQSNYQLLETVDALVINIHEFWLTTLPKFQRQPHQRIIYFTQESPQTMRNGPTEFPRGFFNWTMTYKLDSDIKLLYGRIHASPSAVQSSAALDKNTWMERLRKKSKKVAWMVSHCNTPSQREVYVQKLQQYIDVDIYGGCGNLTCARNATHWLSQPECYNMLENKYKFYLSFENSICNDYVTEKFFQLLQYDIVPVVLGGAHYSRIAPPHSYINALEHTPKELADLLHQLDADDEAYTKYFEWKSTVTVEAGVHQMARHAFCDVCAKLHDDDQLPHFYDSLVESWSPEFQCRPPTWTS